MYIHTPDDLAAFCEHARTSKVLAIDTEFLRERTYYPKLCLIQAATSERSCAIDPIELEDLSPLVELLQDERITKVFHACSQDIEVIYDGLGCVPHPIFDTQVAATFLGFRQQIGYGALVEAYTGVRLPKAEALSDWSRRPLDPEQLKYAEDDVIYLPRMYEKMLDELIERGRLGWIGPEMEALVDPLRYGHPAEEAYLHVRRVNSLTRRQLAIARELAAWREQAAAARDVPRKWVLSDEVLIEACKRTPKSVAQLRRIRGTDQLGEQDARQIVSAIGRGLATKPQDQPHASRHERPSAETESVIDLMYAMLRIISEESGVACQVIATREDLQNFALGHRSRLDEGWRHELAGKPLSRLLSGACGLTVKDGHVEIF